MKEVHKALDSDRPADVICVVAARRVGSHVAEQNTYATIVAAPRLVRPSLTGRPDYVVLLLAADALSVTL